VVELLEVPLSVLEKHQYIRLEETESRTGPGRKPSPTYEVNPVVHQQNQQN